MDKLKPCPFCGGEAKLHYCALLEDGSIVMGLVDKYGVHCMNGCAATMPVVGAEKAVEMWNRRADDA